ncbi:probable protein phosphatase 2C 55 [Alnus glutinosa]|jgi:protein phosphatase PTC7|uniref:probable protein phosphatase 2C 55 n=1 Tax=Alnus glutinosa TaxID=3517 RepID=UPI002D77CFD8|nr:probable protein phosphatase 2C 55 [Alnus glutinosa]
MIIKKRRLEGKLVETTLLNYDRAVPPEESLKMVCGAFYLPKDNELKPEGEDAHFICSEKQAIGVADGVGGWAKKGVDAGEYARELMNNAFIAIQQQPDGVLDPKRVLNEAFLNTEAEGSSTACIAMLKDNILHSVNVGDSGFLIFRDNRLLYQSPTLQHYFNCPYQLGNSKTCDRPSSAEETTVPVVPGDIIVLGTDGLLDNVYPTEIEEVLKEKTLEGVVDPWQLALTIAVDLAFYNSMDKCSCSPFARAAQLAGQKHIGGKIDDITVVVAQIVSQN